MNISNIRKYMFTQLYVNILKEKMERTESGIKVDFKFNKNLSEAFFNDNTIEPNCYISPVRMSFDKRTSKITFNGDLKDFSSVEDFSDFLKSTIKENDLSYIQPKKGNILTNVLNEKMVKNSINHYNLDIMFEKAVSSPPLIKKSEISNNVIIESGDIKHEVSKNSYLLDVVNIMNEMDSLSNELKNSNKRNSKNKIKL